ncbi:hypothetical protein BJV78DRAFT_158541 [Lactifluus subvellereus]|nr:hypothetical protein BJV78DRAFT_158541 [Lactifluus subvellereus]
MNPYNFHVFPPLPHLRIIPDRCRYPKSTRLDISMRISLLRTRRPVDPLSGSTNGFSRLAFEIGLAGCRKTQNSISENRVGMTTQHLDPYSGSEASLTISPVPPRVLSSGLGPSDDILWDQVHEKTSVRPFSHPHSPRKSLRVYWYLIADHFPFSTMRLKAAFKYPEIG